MIIEQLLSFDHITIQCHDNPDADAIASGFGLYSYFTASGKETNFFFGGPNPITKPNLVKMIRLLDIPVEHRPHCVRHQGLLIVVDSQYNAGNVTNIEADHIAVIDHHIQECPPPALSEIRPFLGSCSTLVWKLLTDAGYTPDIKVSTALLYGLMSDTNNFSEIIHPLDRDLRDSLVADPSILKKLRLSNLSLEDLSLASSALNALDYHEDGRFALINVQPCDPNILGFVSDLAIQVDSIDLVIVFSEIAGGIKYSVRTTTRENKASDLATWCAASGLGSGGGHAEKAGGYISAQNFRTLHPSMTPMRYFEERIRSHLTSYRIIDCALSSFHAEDYFGSSRLFKKHPVRQGYAPCSAISPGPANLHVRMLEGDISLCGDENTYLMIGHTGEVYPIMKQKFHTAYTELDGPLDMSFVYPPVVIDEDRGIRVSLDTIAKPCVGINGGRYRAVMLTDGIKLFNLWDHDNYIKGEPGDWLVMHEHDSLDLRIITSEIFPRLYTAA